MAKLEPVACCDRAGVITVITNGAIPPGLLPIHFGGPADRLQRTVSSLARHAFDDAALLVPGIPEAKDGDAALDALSRFSALVADAMLSAPAEAELSREAEMEGIPT